MKLSYLFIIFFAFTGEFGFPRMVVAQAENRLGVTQRVESRTICGFAPLMGFGAARLENNRQAIDIVNSVLETASVDSHFVTLTPSNQVASSIALACENDEGNGAFKRYILYDPSELNRLATDSENKWFITAIFAHEAGHVRLNHNILLRKPAQCDLSAVTNEMHGLKRRDLESEADVFAGQLLERLGASLQETATVFSNIANETGDDCYPSRSERSKSLRAGWIQQWKASHPNQSLFPNAVTSFSFYYDFQPLKGTHFWKKTSDDTWLETYPDSPPATIKEIGRITVDGDEGVLLQHGTISGLEYFIPDKGGRTMWLRDRADGGPWLFLGEMKEIK